MEHYEIRLSGTGGQGLLLSGMTLSEALIGEGRLASQSQSYEPTSRGGLSRADLVVSDTAVDYPLVTALDFLLVLDPIAVAASEGLVKDDAIVLIDSGRVPSYPTGPWRLHALPMEQAAHDIGNPRATNMVALGAILALTDLCRTESLEQAMRGRSPKGFLQSNLDAMARGWQMAQNLVGGAAGGRPQAGAEQTTAVNRRTEG